MKNKITAWTLMELVIALIVVMILSGLCIQNFKPNLQKSRIFMYAAIANLMKGNIAIYELNEELVKPNVGSTDWYCENLADNYTLESAANCSTSAASNVANMIFPNNAAFYGMSSAWNNLYGDDEYTFKNIMIDIDGSSGLNRVGVDRFPMRIYNGGKMTGSVHPVDCSSTSVHDEAGTAYTRSNSYCGSSSINFLKDTSVISYDVHRANSEDEVASATLVSMGLSTAAADCGAYGGNGIYSKTTCSGYGYKMLAKCVTLDNCTGCGAACPINPSTGAQTDEAGCKALISTLNPSNLPCVASIHKPSGGMNMIINTLVGEIEM